MSKRFLTALVLALLTTSTATAIPMRHRCTITEVAVWHSRIHVECSSGPSDQQGIIFFAVPTETTPSYPNPTANAHRFLQMALAALNRPEAPLWLDYDSADESGLEFGCHPINCRSARAIFLGSPSSEP